MDYAVITKLPNSEDIAMTVKANDGHCPCKTIKDESTKCLCQEFRDQTEGECACGLYFKRQAEYVLYTKDGCPRCDILKKELERVGKVYIESKEYPDGLVNLPHLVSSSGVEYTYKEAMALFPRRRR